MEFHKPICQVNYAGWIKLQYRSDYSEEDLLNEDSYPFAESFAIEVCKRWNEHDSLKNTLSNALTQISFMNEMHPCESADAAIKAIEKVLYENTRTH